MLEVHDAAFLCIALNCCYVDRVPDPVELEIVAEFTKLIPPELQTRTTLQTVLTLVRSFKKPPRPTVVASKLPDLLKCEPGVSDLLSRATPRRLLDAQMERLFPFRTRKDAGIRRCRYRDLLLTCHALGEDLVLEQILTWSHGSLDYITTCNVVWYHLCTRQETICPVLALGKEGVFSFGLDHMMDVLKAISDLIKATETDLSEEVWAEMAVVCGYRNLPFAGFDLAAEMTKLTTGTGFDRLNNADFDVLGAIRDTLQIVPRYVEFVTFEEFVMSGKWVTTGSCQFATKGVSPHVKFEWAGEHVKVKMGKNIVPFVFSLAEIYQLSRDNKTQRNMAISKCETGKIRLAVASDLETYLQQSYVVHLCGGAYKDWPGVTLEERPDQTMARELETLRVLRGKLALPFDYKGFDNQPSLTEVKLVWRVLCDMAANNVPSEHRLLFKELCLAVEHGFDDATLEGLINGEVLILKVLWSLMSGLRITSIVGNGWNSSITFGIVIKKLTKWTGLKPDAVSVQGDDTQMIHKQWGYLMMAKILYDVVGAESNESKFKVGTSGSYLRKIFEANTSGEPRVRGYRARGITALTQRKPWSEEQWSPFSQLSAQWEALQTLRARGADPQFAQAAWKSIVRNWSSTSGVDSRWLSLPSALGGCGLGDWDGSRPSARLPKPDVPSPEVSVHVDAVVREEERFRANGFMVRDGDLGLHVQDKYEQTMATNRQPAVDRLLRDSFKDKMSKLSIAWSVPTKIPVFDSIVTTLPATKEGYQAWKKVHTVETFGGAPELAELWEQAGVMARMRGTSRMMELEAARPALAHRIKQMSKRAGGVSRGDIVDWLTGSLPGANMGWVTGKARDWAAILASHYLRAPCSREFIYRSYSVWQNALKAISVTPLFLTLCRC